MDINSLIAHYGYAALLVGSLAEGETITLLGGVAAHQGLLKFPVVVLAVAVGGMIGDQLLYFCGRRFGTRALKRFAGYQNKINRAQQLIQRYPGWFVIGTRFMYGFRIIGPILIGASHVPPRLFLPLNIIGALLWATIFTSLGYLGGEVVEPWLHKVDQHLRYLVLLAVVVGAGLLLRLWLRRRSSRKKHQD